MTREQIVEIAFKSAHSETARLLGCSIVDLATFAEHIAKLEREAFVELLEDMIESDAQMGRITDKQVQKAIKLCEESK